MKIEVLNGADGGVVARGIDPTDGSQFAGTTIPSGEKVVITLPEVHEASGVEFGDCESITPQEQPETETT